VIAVGKHQELIVLRGVSVGLFLGDGQGEEVLLPDKYCPAKYEVGAKMRVFVYRDHEERKVAVTTQPKILLHQFALLKVTDVSAVGAFVDWGMEKELFVPFKEQRRKMETGRWYIVYLDLDKETDRLYASNRLDNFLDNDTLTVQQGDEVDLLVAQKTELGFNVIVNHKHKGLVFGNEVFKPLNVGDKLKGFVKKIREDNKLDISLQPIGYRNAIDPNTDLILRKLSANNGRLALTDQSSPEEIYERLGISKKAFKKAIGALYKQGKIELLPQGIKLIGE
jgi:predicted RNA-binding protein (virulence factor B family)